MENHSASHSFHCPQCGAELEIPTRELFFPCSFCGSSLYLDRREVVLHYVLTCTIGAERAESILKAWMAGPETVKDLEIRSEILNRAFKHVPLWHFNVKLDDEEHQVVEPAVSTGRDLLKKLAIPPGERRYDSSEEVSNMVAPTVPYLSAMETALGKVTRPDQVLEAALVHVPVYFFRYRYQEKTYVAAVDGSFGQVLREHYPARPEFPFRIVAAATLWILCAGALATYLLLPLVGYDLTPFCALQCGILGVIALPLFAIAWLTVQKA